jgi:predicted alpha/beta hydrolase family esterase
VVALARLRRTAEEAARWVAAALLAARLAREAWRAATSDDWVERLGALVRLPLIAAAALVAVLIALREPRE